MNRHVNHRGWIVVCSVASPDGGYCVDFYQHPAGGFGFEHFRSDPEDMGRWTALGGSGSRRFKTVTATAEAAAEAVAWFSREMLDRSCGEINELAREGPATQ